MIPVQMWSNPLWAQFVADTLPEMAFASAWTLLVSFFVQLVGVALGMGTVTSTVMVPPISGIPWRAFYCMPSCVAFILRYSVPHSISVPDFGRCCILGLYDIPVWPYYEWRLVVYSFFSSLEDEPLALPGKSYR